MEYSLHASRVSKLLASGRLTNPPASHRENDDGDMIFISFADFVRLQDESDSRKPHNKGMINDWDMSFCPTDVSLVVGSISRSVGRPEEPARQDQRDDEQGTTKMLLPLPPGFDKIQKLVVGRQGLPLQCLLDHVLSPGFLLKVQKLFFITFLPLDIELRPFFGEKSYRWSVDQFLAKVDSHGRCLHVQPEIGFFMTNWECSKCRKDHEARLSDAACVLFALKMIDIKDFVKLTFEQNVMVGRSSISNEAPVVSKPGNARGRLSSCYYPRYLMMTTYSQIITGYQSAKAVALKL